jgi:hypothetical protein
MKNRQMRRSARRRLSMTPAMLLAAVGLFAPGFRPADAADVERVVADIPPGEYRVQRWVPPPGTTGPQFFYLLMVAPAPAPAILEPFFVTDLGVLPLEAIARDIDARGNAVAPAEVIVERLRAGDGSVSGHVVRTRGVRFSVAPGGGRQTAVYLHTTETFESGGGGGM